MPIWDELMPRRRKKVRQRSAPPPADLSRHPRMGETVPCNHCKTTGQRTDPKEGKVTCLHCGGAGFTFQPWAET